MPQNKACTLCTLSRTTQNRCIYGDGPAQADIFLIGEAPGAEEEKGGKPFIGPAGKKLTEALTDAGLDRSSVYISNAAKCRPPQNRKPEANELASCLPYLLEEIEAVQPKVIICLGNVPMGVLTGINKDITKRRGKVLSLTKGLRINAPVMATFHPSSVLHPGGAPNYARIVEDFKFARSLMHQNDPVAADPLMYRFPPGSSDESIIEALRLLSETKNHLITCDLEWTAGRNSEDMIWPWSQRGDVHSISFTGETDAGVVSVALSWPLSPVVAPVVHRLLKNRSIGFHNATSDMLWLTAKGFDPALSADSMVLTFLLDETQPRGLEDVAVKYGGVQGGWKNHLFQQRPQTSDQWDEILTYNAEDTKATLYAVKGLANAVRALEPQRRQDVFNLHKHLLLPVTKVLTRAALVGVPIDRQQLQVEIQATEGRFYAAGEELADVLPSTPQRAIDLALSPKQTMDYMKSLGIQEDNTEQDTLKKYADAYSGIAGILKVREESKLLNTYLRPWAMLIDRQGDGRLHSVYKPVGARTGRSSAEGESGGTIQTAPRKVWIRALVKMPAGRVLVSGDLSTVEMRMAAFYANEQTMISMFQEGESFDIHKAVAAFIKRQAQGPIALDEFLANRAAFEALVTKLERQGAKGVNFGLAFGMMEEKLVEYSFNTYGVVMTLEQAKFARDSYMRLFSQLPVWHDRARALARSTGYSQRTVFGRIRKFDDRDDINAAINTPVQSTANDFAYLGMVQVDQYIRQEGLDAVVIGYIHDSVMIDSSERDAPRVLQLLEYAMENTDTSAFGFKFPIPLPAEVKAGESWAA